MEKKDLKEYSLEFAVEALAFAEKIKINTIKVHANCIKRMFRNRILAKTTGPYRT